MVGILDPMKYGEYFYELYTNNSRRKQRSDHKSRSKRKNKDKKIAAALDGDANAGLAGGAAGAVESGINDILNMYPVFSMAQISLEANASKFAVFASIRSSILEAETKYALFQENSVKKLTLTTSNSSCCLLCASSSLMSNCADCSCHTVSSGVAGVGGKRVCHGSIHSDDSELDDDIEKEKSIIKVPFIVGAGLRSLFELIADARNIQPILCTKALKALLDVIQGQQPESFKQEPENIINQLYDLLLDLSTMPGATSGCINSSEFNWSSMACSALIGLCIARGDTGKTLKAIAALLMSPKKLSTQLVHLPTVLLSLQRTVMSAALKKPTFPDLHNNGVPQNSLIDEFTISSDAIGNSQILTQPAMASDGTYIYLLLGSALFKIGTGFGGSYRGHIYATNTGFAKEKCGWLGYSGGCLYFKANSRRGSEPLHIVNTDNLSIKGNISIPVARDGLSYVLFTDENAINVLCANRDDSLVVKQINGQQGESHSFELPLKLARKKFRTLGYAAFEDEVLNQNQIQKIQSSYNIFEPKIPNDIEIQGIACGKEFGLVLASNGKVYYYGKSGSLGLKSVGRTPTMKMTELIISKVSNIVHIAIGHDGVHALLVNDDGTVYFAGTARRGEDGDTSKNRRQPKAVKPKKMTKIDGHVIIQAACNNGTSAFVTKAGKLIMFGKDTAHCDSMGFVNDFADQHIVKVALGKAHCVALNSKGQLFTFGLNNKGQCGRVFTKSKESCTVSNAGAEVDYKNDQNDKKLKFDFSSLCDYDDHTVVQGQCRVCVVCQECTGYNISCVSSLKVPIEDRVAGAICPCGHGDAGCSKCGLCSTCISVQERDNDSSDAKIRTDRLQRSKIITLRRKEKKIGEDSKPQVDLDKDPPRVAPMAPQLLSLPSNSPVIQIACGLHHTVALTLAGEVFTFGSNQYGQLGTGDLQPINGPIQVKCHGSVSHVAAGSNHTVIMTSKGMVYTFGNYQKGQLGRLPNECQSKASAQDEAGSSDIKDVGITKLMENGGCSGNAATRDNYHSQRQKYLWNCTPGSVFGLGPTFGKKATWIGASGDQTFIKIDESLITPQLLPKVNVVANKKTILLIPTIPQPFLSLSINRRDGSCSAHYKNQVNFVQMIQNNKANIFPEINQNFTGNDSQRGIAGTINEQMSRSMHEARNQIFDLHENHMYGDLQRKRRNKHDHHSRSVVGGGGGSSSGEKMQPQIAFAIDPFFNVLWVYDGSLKKLLCYNVIASEIPKKAPNASNFRALLSPELALPSKIESRVSRSQASLNLLACLDILTSAQDAIPSCFEEVIPYQQNQIKESQNSDYQIVNRFDNFGGGWGYSGHSVEAIRFSVDTDVMICGFGMFGGRGEYTCKLKVFDLGTDGGVYEKDGILISEIKEIPYECAARSKHHILLSKPFTALAGRWYLVWARIAGPSSDCGSAGQASVTTEDQIVFSFKSSKKANNGTDVNSGQIPSILYRLITLESKQPSPPIDSDPVQKVSKAFANTVTKDCFESLVVLLSWSWEAFKANIREQKDKSRYLQVRQSLDYLVYVNKSCLRLLRKYTNEIYPQREELSTSCNASTSAIAAAALGKLQSKTKTHEGVKCIGDGGGGGGGSDKPTKATTTGRSVGTSVNSSTPTMTRKHNLENIHLAECIGNVRALLISIFCDDILKDVCSEEGLIMVSDILDECHISFVACFHIFYPTSSLKWNCLCDLLSQIDKGILHARLLSAILAGLCSPSIKLRSTFSLLAPGNERQSIISPSDNSGLPMLTSTEAHQYPILVEQMVYRTQQEKNDFNNVWVFKDVLVRLLDIIASPIRSKIENIYNRSIHFNNISKFVSKEVNQGLINNCCHLLARVLAEIVYQSSVVDFDKMFLPPRCLHSTGSRFTRCDLSRTWNTGNFGPDAIAFTVDRPGIAIAGIMAYSGSGSYDYQLELLYDNTVDVQSQHKWETLESVSGSYDQDAVHNDMTEIKFERPVYLKENIRYALRLCSQGARTCSGDSGMTSLRGPCGVTFNFYSCDLSFNGTTPQRGQIPCILYYSAPIKSENHSYPVANFGSSSNEVSMRDTALQITADITKKCTELLILARNALAASLSPSDNSSNHTQTIDSEHNITPIEEHMDINWANNSRIYAPPVDPNIPNAARDITKRFESFSKGIMETLKFEKRSTNPFEMEIEIGATEIYPKDLILDDGRGLQDLNFRNGQITTFNGNERADNDLSAEYENSFNQSSLNRSDNDDPASQHFSIVNILDIFNNISSNMFHTLLPLVYAHVGTLASTDPKWSVQILGLIKEILPHIAALNQLYLTRDQDLGPVASRLQRVQNSDGIVGEKPSSPFSIPTTSNHYCTVESEHPYRSASINCYRVEFPSCVQWITIEFDAQCGMAQLEDYLLLSIPVRSTRIEQNCIYENYFDILDNNMSVRKSECKYANVINSCNANDRAVQQTVNDSKEYIVIKKFNTSSNWSQNVMVLPGNCVEFSLETASLYAHDPNTNKFGFKCLVVGYDNPVSNLSNNCCLLRLEQELAYLGGMCSANLMKKELNLPDDKNLEDLTDIEETLNTHFGLLSKGFALAEPGLTVHQALESYLPIGTRSNERQFLKDFISGAPGSSGARLAAWLQPEPRLDPNKCELNTINEPLRYGWPTPVTVTIRDQYGDPVLVPELKVEIKAIPTGATGNGNIKMRRPSATADGAATTYGGVAPPPRLSYEPTIKDKMCFKAITFMKAFSNYSFEELRLNSPTQTRITETLHAQDMENGTFSVHWTPNSIGSYCLAVSIDGILLEEVYRVEVKEGGQPPPSQRQTVKKPQPPNKLRKFHTKNTAGLRIRSHPTLQSEQVGVIKLDGVISFIDEIENDDGIWLRLSTESIRQHCTMGWYPTEAWCLQYNQHLNKTLLHPVTENNSNSTSTTTMTAVTTAITTQSASTTTSTAVSTSTSTSTSASCAINSPTHCGKSKTKRKILLDSIDSPILPASSIESPTKPQSTSPSKRTFEYPPSRLATPKTSDSHTSTNPFFFSQSERTDSESSNHDSDKTKGFDIQSISTSSESQQISSQFYQSQSDLLSSSSIPGSNQSNIGSTIAGVVGGGASKLQALQKWFKGDSAEASASSFGDNKDRVVDKDRKRSEVNDLPSVSVRELVRAIGGHEMRASSPVRIPKPEKLQDSTTSSISCSPTQNSSHSLKNVKDDFKTSGDFEVATIKKTNFTASQKTALLSTPKHSARKVSNGVNVEIPASPKTKTYEKPVLAVDVNICRNGTTTNNESSNQEIMKIDELKTASTTSGTDSSSTPDWPIPNAKPTTTSIGPIKTAMPPSLAESIRAVFAAFLWHEDIVHDAMACASFLKFHPSLPKEGATVVTRRDGGDNKLQLSREQKAQQRHSVEVANAGSYLNIRPSTLEALTKSGNSSVNNRKYRKNLSTDSGENVDRPKLHSVAEIVTVLPPALRCLVYLWEEVCSSCIHVVQTNSMERQKMNSPTHEMNIDSNEKIDTNEREMKKSKKIKKDDGSWCELCDVFLPIPVTYHMRIVHPGCGKSAKGKGYNSVGIFCEGWAGNCGEGGKGASSWFLMCDTCREKYISSNKNTSNINNPPNSSRSINETNIFGVKTTTLIANSEIYNTMRENATFLLELSSSVSNLPTGTNPSMGAFQAQLNSSTTKRSPQQMPVVIENQNFIGTSDINKPSTSRGDSARNSRIGLRMSGKFGCSTPHRKSYVGASISPDCVWSVPDTFACLESLGVANNDDNLPYEIFGLSAADNTFERPLSEISYESCDPNNYDLITGSTSTQPMPVPPTSSGTLSKFHRSFSMGQGWAAAQQQNNGFANLKGITANLLDENQQPKVIYRRRNNSITESEGSLLICYPSENLRRLVPEKIFASSIIHSSVDRGVLTNDYDTEKSKIQLNANEHDYHTKIMPNQEDVRKELKNEKAQESMDNKEKDYSLIVSTSPQKITASSPESSAQINTLLSRSSMSFITQKHNLDKLRCAMKRSLRIATCRIYALQALNWLIRSVTQSVCLHDLMWWFVSSLSTSTIEAVDGKYDETERALEHPVSFTQFSGRFSNTITQSLHLFLQSVADLTLFLPPGSSLQRIAIQCFGIRFRQADHQFLHSSHVFGNISKILSRSDEQDDIMAMSTMAPLENAGGLHEGGGAKLLYYTDLNGMFEVTVSSRQGMVESLTDNSTETFWESDEEDRNKCKIIEISLNKFTYACKIILVHIDNSRDIQNKVLNVVFYGGQSLGDTNLIKSIDVEPKACSWISAKVHDESYTHFRLEFHGPENTLRVRQIKLLGLPRVADDIDDHLVHHYGLTIDQRQNHLHKSNWKLTNATRIQQQMCEAETLRVFRLITGQVFGKLISIAASESQKVTDSHHHSALGLDSSTANSMLADSLDLREHMVGILFSRSKLSHLQKQVIVHIVHAIKKEAQRAKADWEIVTLSNCFKENQGTTTSTASASGDPKSESSSERYRLPDTYCFEMLSMVLALSGSSVGRSYLAHQHGLLRDLLSLLHTGSDRVQRQVTALIRRILPEISPENFAEILGVQRLPPTDYSIAHQSTVDFDMNRLGLFDIFLAVIAKSLQVQVKVKTTANFKSNVEKTPSFVRLCNSLDLSVHLLKHASRSDKGNDRTIEEEAAGGIDFTNTVTPFCFMDGNSADNDGTINYRANVAGINVSTLKSSKKNSTKNLNQRWFLNGVISTKQAESIISLIRDLASGKLSEKWSHITKATIAEAVLNLTRLDEFFRTPENCIKTATLWLALASLCVLDRDHVEKLSSGQWSKVSETRPMCSNHDDGETAAIIQCVNCGSLCGDCDRFLHLNRKTRTHKRTVCKEEEEAIRVELHESCGRTKLFWLLALADSKTLKGMVEFRDGSHTIISGVQETVGRCRFCGITGNTGLLEISNVCADPQCQEYAANSCLKSKPCGHVCGGVANEKKCLPCLQHVCHARENELADELHEPKLTQDADDMCMICFVEALSCAPSIHLDCGHVFHYHCCKMVLEKRWSGPRITFGFSLCPICKADIQHALLAEILEPINVLKQDVKRKALMRLKYEGVVKETDAKDITNMAMDRYAYYVCFKCQKAYYGGEARCDAEIGEKFNPEELVCGGCSDVARAQMCPKHGTDFLEYKCRYCCSVAVFFCFGTTHFCDTCHDDFQRLTNISKSKLPQCPAGPKAKQLIGDECPLHVIHPATGEEFALGCGVCRNAQTF